MFHALESNGRFLRIVNFFRKPKQEDVHPNSVLSLRGNRNGSHIHAGDLSLHYSPFRFHQTKTTSNSNIAKTVKRNEWKVERCERKNEGVK